ncbi:hypothetical protein AB0H43_02930 [Hamadaea sp. NPDC050747]|uniref:hypothetical protein n=1 Tax=Hamadaea sp. NPDC050747 TaxID=3155789 RepID=UPI00340AFB75
MSSDRDAVKRDALGSIEAWLPGHTFPEEGPQERVALVGGDDDAVIVSYEPAMSSYLYGVEPTRTFRITVNVEEVTEP